MDPLILIGVLGSVASIVSLFLAKPDLKSRVLHVAYAILLVAISTSAVIYNRNILDKLNDANSEAQRLEQRLRINESRAKEARKLLDARGYETTSDVGRNRGFILSGLAFLEKNKQLFPDMYDLAKKMASDGIRITEFAGSVGSPGYYDEQKRMADGAATIASILRGIAE
jgi:hypothetical protein